MTTDEMQLLRDFRKEVPAPDEETMQRAYAYATSGASSGWQQSLRLLPVHPLRLRFALPAAAAICAAVVGAVIFTGALGGSGTHPATYGSGGLSLGGGSGSKAGSSGSNPPAKRGARPMGFTPITLNATRSGQTITSIAVTLNSSVADATLQLQVLRGDPYGPDSGRHVVFQEQVPMSNIASPANGPPGTVALSTWSGTLSPSDWEGGCQDALYTVAFATVPVGSSFDNPPSGSNSGWSRWFNCSGGSNPR